MEQPARRGQKALIEIGPALWDAFFGNTAAARKRALEAASLAKDRDVEYGAAFALALAGESERSQALAKDLDMRFPEDTAVQYMYLPPIRALDALNAGAPSKALDLLRVVAAVRSRVAAFCRSILYRTVLYDLRAWFGLSECSPGRGSREGIPEDCRGAHDRGERSRRCAGTLAIRQSLYVVRRQSKGEERLRAIPQLMERCRSGHPGFYSSKKGICGAQLALAKFLFPGSERTLIGVAGVERHRLVAPQPPHHLRQHRAAHVVAVHAHPP